MALVKVPGPNSLPLTSADYEAQNDLQLADGIDLEKNIRIVSSTIPKGSLFQVGGTYYYGSSDTSITGTSSDYVKITPSVDTLTATASFVSSLTGVTWNTTYNGYYDSSGNLYIFDEAKALQATAISTIMTRYVKQDSNGDVVIGRNITIPGQVNNDLTVEDDLTVGNDLTVGSLNITIPTTGFTAGNNSLYYDNIEEYHNSTLPAYKKSLWFPLTGTFRFKFDIKSSAGGSVSCKLNIGTTKTTTSTSYVTFSEDIAVSGLTVLSLRLIASSSDIYVTNFSICVAESVSDDIKNIFTGSFKVT